MGYGGRKDIEEADTEFRIAPEVARERGLKVQVKLILKRQVV